MKKVIAWLLVLALTAAVSIGATLAYLTDTDEDVNVMTLGKVKIDQLEYERVDVESKDDDATVQEFHDNKPLLPAVTDKNFDYTPGTSYVDWEQIGKDGYTSDIWDPTKINNEVDKMVFVKNKGDYDAYVRSVFAFEAGKYTTLDEFQKMVHLNLNTTDYTWEWVKTPVAIPNADGSASTNYFIATATYNKVLAPDALTEISLSQIALDKTATNEDVEAFGETYQVLVKSQGIQADGFTDPDTALNEGFGEISEENVPWTTDNAIQGIDLKTALRNYEGDPSNSIAKKVTNVVFGLNKDNADIVNKYTGTLVDVEQDVPVYAYYVPNGSNYDVYFLANDEIFLPKRSSGLFSGMSALQTVSCDNLNTSRTTNMYEMFYNCANLTTVDAADWDVSKVTNMCAMFDSCKSLQVLDSADWDTGNVKNMSYMFMNCNNLSSLGTSGWDTGKVTTFYSMFFKCQALTTLDVSKWNTSSATNMGNMFDRCSKINGLDVSNWDVSKVTAMQSMFNACGSLTALDVSKWDTGSATNMDFMFFENYNLEYLNVSNWDVSNVTTFVKMFASGHQNEGDMKLQNLDVSKWRPVSAVNMGAMFYGCGQLTKLDMSGWNTPNLTILTHTFADCFKLEEINLLGWQTPSLISMDAMFNHCKVLKEVNMSSFDTSNVKEFSQMFEHCYALETIEGMENWDTSSGCTFTQMFTSCGSLTKLDLSGFDTSSAYDNYVDTNNSKSMAFSTMFSGLSSIQTLIVGDEIVYLGNGNVSEGNKLTFPAPAAKAGFTAKWQNVDTGVLYDASEIPEEVAATYVAYYTPNP